SILFPSLNFPRNSPHHAFNQILNLNSLCSFYFCLTSPGKFLVMNTATCYISKKKHPVTDLYKGHFLKKEIVDLIKKDFPDFNESDYISIESLNEYRKKYMATLLKQENAEI